MATISFAIPLNDESKQTGDITYKKLKDNSVDVEFLLTNAISGGEDVLDLITRKGSVSKHHIFDLDYQGGSASVTVGAEDIRTVWVDADGGDWDYVEAQWRVGGINQPNPSEQYELQTFNGNGWPPIG